MNERDNAYLRDMLAAAREAIGFVQGLDFGAFRNRPEACARTSTGAGNYRRSSGQGIRGGCPIRSWNTMAENRRHAEPADSWLPRGGLRARVEGRHRGFTIARHRVGATAEGRVRDGLQFPMR